MKKVIVLALGAAVMFSSCKKDSANNSNCDKTMANIAGTYSLVSIKAGLPGTTLQDVTSTEVEDCQRDDKLTLNANGTVTYTDAGTKCDPDGSDTGTWSITSAGKITITGTGSTDVSSADISSFDCTNLVLSGTEVIFGTTAQFQFTLKK